jgi:hypothetical protein
MSQLFQTAACMTDIHLGLKNNSRTHLDDCDRFIDWFITEAKARNAETCIFLGDWHHHRATINSYTLSETTKQLRKLNANFEKIYFITGNHDLYFKDNRSVNSLEYARDLSNFVMVDKLFVQDDVAIVPWLVADEWKTLKKVQVKYMFGHFELPYFKMNAMIEMPDHGGLNSDHLKEPEYGAMFLTWDEEPVYVNWPDCPKYRTLTLSQLLDDHAKLLDEYTHARVKLDIDVSYEEATFIKEQFAEQYNVRELHLLPANNENEQFEGTELEFESVDHIVVSQLDTIESETIDKNKLIALYNGLTI